MFFYSHEKIDFCCSISQCLYITTELFFGNADVSKIISIISRNDDISVGNFYSEARSGFTIPRFARPALTISTCRVAPKKASFLYAVTSSNINRFSKNYFTVRIRRKFVIILQLKMPPHLKCVTTLPCEMSSVLKTTIENKTISVIAHFKEINNRKQRVCLSYCLK